MLEFRQLGETTIKVFKLESTLETSETKVGSITDQCCYTLMYLDKIHHPIKIKYEVGKGGFISKKKDNVPIYRDKLLEIFNYLYESQELRIYLKKRSVELNRNHIEEGTYISILKKFEREIKS